MGLSRGNSSLGKPQQKAAERRTPSFCSGDLHSIMSHTNQKWLEIVHSARVKDLLRARKSKLVTIDHNEKLGDAMKAILLSSCRLFLTNVNHRHCKTRTSCLRLWWTATRRNSLASSMVPFMNALLPSPSSPLPCHAMPALMELLRIIVSLIMLQQASHGLIGPSPLTSSLY